MSGPRRPSRHRGAPDAGDGHRDLPRPRRHRRRLDRHGDRVLRPPARVARPPRAVRPRDPRDRRPRRRRAPHGRGRRARPRAAFAEALGDRAGIRRFGDSSADGRKRRHGGHRHRRPAVRRSTCRSAPSAPGSSRCSSSTTPGIVRADGRRDAPPARHRPQRPSPRRGGVQGLGRAAGRVRARSARMGIASTKGSLG